MNVPFTNLWTISPSKWRYEWSTIILSSMTAVNKDIPRILQANRDFIYELLSLLNLPNVAELPKRALNQIQLEE